MLGLSQERLGEAIGLTFQQVQNYEHGVNRSGRAGCYELSPGDGCAGIVLFRRYRPGARARRWAALPSRRVKPSNPIRCASAETIELVRAYLAIEDATVRQHLMSIFKNFDKYSHPLRIKRLQVS